MDIEHLLSRRLQGLATDEENRLIAEWTAQAPENRAVLDRLESEGTLREDLVKLFQLVDSAEGEARLQRMKTHIHQTIKRRHDSNIRRTTWFTWQRYVAAAAALIILAVGAYYYQHQPTRETIHGPHLTADVHPGSNRATLTLADGRTVNLSETQAGIVVGDEITYQDGSEVLDRGEEDHSTLATYLTLSTPKGGTYQLTLPDGTKVWLNAASTLKYPSRFNGKERIVELEGEAYFDVMHIRKTADSPSVPFRIMSKGQQVEVLGTQFNISAYADENSAKITLVKGSVRVVPTADHQPVIIKPGEQATVRSSGIHVASVDTNQYIAWKEGRFHFRRTPLEDVMRQVSRWYDVEVVYQRGIPKESFTGKVSRSASLMELLHILQLSAIDVKLEGDRLIVN